jgi:hypothetical protein
MKLVLLSFRCIFRAKGAEDARPAPAHTRPSGQAVPDVERRRARQANRHHPLQRMSQVRELPRRGFRTGVRAEEPVHIPPFACSRCGTKDYLDIALRVPSAEDCVTLRVRRPVKPVRRWIWQTFTIDE